MKFVPLLLELKDELNKVLFVQEQNSVEKQLLYLLKMRIKQVFASVQLICKKLNHFGKIRNKRFLYDVSFQEGFEHSDQLQTYRLKGYIGWLFYSAFESIHTP